MPAADLSDADCGRIDRQVMQAARMRPRVDDRIRRRAEDVVLERLSAAVSSARNHLDAVVASIVPEGAADRVALDCGFPLDALVTRQAREELGISVGVRVVAVLKATAVHLVVRS